MNKRRCIIHCLLALVMLLACSACAPKITSGKIVEKHFEPAHDSYEFWYFLTIGGNQRAR